MRFKPLAIVDIFCYDILKLSALCCMLTKKRSEKEGRSMRPWKLSLSFVVLLALLAMGLVIPTPTLAEGEQGSWTPEIIAPEVPCAVWLDATPTTAVAVSGWVAEVSAREAILSNMDSSATRPADSVNKYQTAGITPTLTNPEVTSNRTGMAVAEQSIHHYRPVVPPKETSGFEADMLTASPVPATRLSTLFL